MDTTVGTGADIAVLQMDGRETRSFVRTASAETNPRFAPDGQTIAYASDESGASEVYIRAFPGPAGQVSPAGGSEPVWSHDGQELYYRNGDRMLAVRISRRPTLTVSAPRTLFEGRYLRTDTGGAGYDVSATGRF